MGCDGTEDLRLEGRSGSRERSLTGMRRDGEAEYRVS